MSKPISNASNKNLWKGFLHDKLSIGMCGVSFFFLATVYFLFFQKTALSFFPSDKNIRVDFYDDKFDNGNSTLEGSLLNDTCIGISFILRKGFIGPYVGMIMYNRINRLIDLSAYNRLIIKASGQGVKHLLVYLVTKDKNVIDSTNIMALRHSCAEIEISSENKEFKLNINDFKTPDWWYERINQSPKEFENPELDRVSNITFVTGANTTLDTKHWIRVTSLVFKRDNTRTLSVMLAIQFGIIFFAFVLYYIKNSWHKAPVSVTINYKPVVLEEKLDNQYGFLDYIQKNFHEAELSLTEVSKYTGVSQRNIADTISEKFKCNFKTYINQIRVYEAQRLLRESNLNISEIAYKVGFSSPGSFNRVFKNQTGMTPSEFMQKSD